MTEPKRATWREFVEWLRRKRSDKDGELRRVAPEVQTRGEAALVCRFVLGLGRTSTGHLVDEWLGWLRVQGVPPPADPTSVAEVLESVAVEIATAGECFCDGLQGDEARQLRLAFGCAAAIARSKAKEFT